MLIILSDKCLEVIWFREQFLYLFLNKECVLLKHEDLVNYIMHNHNKTSFIMLESEFCGLEDGSVNDNIILINETYDGSVADELLFLLDMAVGQEDYTGSITMNTFTSNIDNCVKTEIVEVEKVKEMFSDKLNIPVTAVSRLNMESLEFSQIIYKFLKGNSEGQYIVIDLDTSPTLTEWYKFKLNPLLNLDNLKEMWDIDPERLDYNVLYIQGTVNIHAWNELLCSDWNVIFDIWRQKGVFESAKVIVLTNLENNFTKLFRSMAEGGRGIIVTKNKFSNLRDVLLRVNSDIFTKVVIAVDGDISKFNRAVPIIKVINYGEIGGVLSE